MMNILTHYNMTAKLILITEFKTREVTLPHFNIETLCSHVNVRPTLGIRSVQDQEFEASGGVTANVDIQQSEGTGITIVRLIPHKGYPFMFIGNTEDYVRDAIFHPYPLIANS